MADKEFCQCCGRELNPSTAVMLDLDQRINAYHDFGDVPPEDSQGGFLFGAACARKARAKARAALVQLQNHGGQT